MIKVFSLRWEYDETRTDRISNVCIRGNIRVALKRNV